MKTKEALRMLEAHREYAEKTMNFDNECDFVELLAFIEQLKKENEILKCKQCNDKGMIKAGPCQDGRMYSIECAHINQR